MTREAVAKVGTGAITTSLESLSDIELVKRSQSGNREAFSELVRRHQNMVYNVAYRFMRDAALAEDMAQESFLKAYRLLKGFRGDCSFSTWMYRVTSTTCLTEISRRKKRGETGLYVDTPIEQNVIVHSPSEKDLKEQIRRCVTKLSERYATIVTLYYLKGVSYEEIAQAMNIPKGTLKTWMFRARKQLRMIVEKELLPNGPSLHSYR